MKSKALKEDESVKNIKPKVKEEEKTP